MPSVRGFIDKYIFHQQKPEAPPPITTGTAVALLVLYTVIYVAPFYLSARTRPSPGLSRDAPSVIRARVASVTLSCAVCSALTLWVLAAAGGASPAAAAHLMGWWPAGVAEAARATALTALLFAGPLFEHLVVDGGWRAWALRRLEPLREVLTEWPTWRNIVAGPVTEEILFRSAGVPLLLLARAPASRTVLLAPLLFGLAHAHHFYEFRVTHPQVPVAAAAVRSLFQLAYTTLFGAYATFVFLRTGSLLAICAVHAFCNCMGLPRLWGRVGADGGDGSLSPEQAKREGEDQRGEGSRSASLGWTVAYYVLLVAGAIMFYRNLWPLTDSPLALVAME